MLLQNAMHRGRRNGHGMETLQIIRNHAGPEVVVLPQVQDLLTTSRRVARGDRCGVRGWSHKALYGRCEPSRQMLRSDRLARRA